MRHVLWIATIILMLPTATLRGAMGPGRVDLPLLAGQTYDAGLVTIHNNNSGLLVDVQAANGWKLVALHVHAGWSGEPVPMVSGNGVPGQFQFKYEYKTPAAGETLWLDFAEALKGFRWGQPYEPMRTRHIAVHADMVLLDAKGKIINKQGAWAKGNQPFTGGEWGWWLEYGLTHKAMAHFVDSPVQGIRAVTPTTDCKTDASGAFEYFPGERVSLSLGSQPLGSAEADHRITPLDLFPGATLDDARVGNMARLLQSLDADGDPQAGISITPEVVACFETAVATKGHVADWADSDRVDALIDSTITACAGVAPLVEVELVDALDNLERSVNGNMFRKNGSNTPELVTTKAKLEMMPVLIPATKANEDPVKSEKTGGNGVDYFDELGNYLYTRATVKPLVMVYTDENAETGVSDTWAAVSRDDGSSWKRMNLSRAADRTSFTLLNGTVVYGDVKKPNLTVKGNYALAAWQSKFCRGGRPLYSRDETDPHYADDVWGVGGPQRSYDYTEDGFPEVGELPFNCLWIARGTIEPDGEISWRKPERLTSGRRDVYQISINGAKDVGFSVIWQEDPEGVRPGEAAGPGHGWSGATTSHKTDIWYSFIKWGDFAPLDAGFSPNGDPEHSYDDPEWTSNRPMPAVPFSLPVRMSDNDVCNTDNMKVEIDPETGLPPKDENGKFVFTPLQDPSDPDWDGKHAGTHCYCYKLDDNANGVPDLCAAFHTFVNSQGATKNVCVTEDGRLLNGDTGASRPNISFMPYSGSSWISIAYEETKGVGSGSVTWDADDETTHFEEKNKADVGKNVIYHAFDFAKPVKVSGGDIVNLPETDAAGNPVYLVDEVTGQQLLDFQGKPQLAYENARRPRMLVQSASKAGPSGTVLVMLYKQGQEGKGRPSDIFMRRIVKSTSGNPFSFKNFFPGAQNISSVSPTEFWQNPDQDDQAKGEGTKVVKFTQTSANAFDASSTNPYDDARAHRGILRGDNLFIAYDHTPNWAASRNAHDKYDVYVRRSFTGGKSWSTDPRGTGPVCHTRTWKDYSSVVSEDEANQKETYEEVECFDAGSFEPSRNLSQLKNNKTSVIEPRLVGPPSSVAGSPYPEDIENPDVFYVAFGTETNVPKAHGDDEDFEEIAAPEDLFYTFTRDRGQSFQKRDWFVNPDSDGNFAGQIVERYDYLAKGDAEQSEAQLRMSPDGSKFYAVWNEDGPEGSDTWFRRIMSSAFPQNKGPQPQ